MKSDLTKIHYSKATQINNCMSNFHLDLTSTMNFTSIKSIILYQSAIDLQKMKKKLKKINSIILMFGSQDLKRNCK